MGQMVCSACGNAASPPILCHSCQEEMVDISQVPTRIDAVLDFLSLIHRYPPAYSRALGVTLSPDQWIAVIAHLRSLAIKELSRSPVPQSPNPATFTVPLKER
jgi:hypothetical protein